MSASRRYGIIKYSVINGSFLDGKELRTMSNVKRKDSKGRNLRLGREAREKTEDTFTNIPICTGNHSLSMLGNLFRQTRHPLGKREDLSLRGKAEKD